MEKKKFDLQNEELINMFSAFQSIENIVGFKVDTILKITHAQYEIEKYVNPFTKARTKAIQDKRITNPPTDYEKNLNYVAVNSDGIKSLLYVKDYLKIDEDFEKDLKKLVKGIELPIFELNDFEVEKEVTDGDKKSTKKVNPITAGLMKNIFKLLKNG